MNATDITLALASKLGPRQVLLVPNVSWGFLPWGESDLLAVSKAGFLTEYEIKTTISDLKRERKKKRWANGHMEMAFRVRIRRYYIAIPRSMLDKAMAVPGILPSDAGVIAIEPSSNIYGPRFRVSEIRKPTVNREALPLSDREIAKLARLGTLRFWSLFRKMNQVEESA